MLGFRLVFQHVSLRAIESFPSQDFVSAFQRFISSFLPMAPSPVGSGMIVIFRKVLTDEDCDLTLDRLSVPPYARVYLENFCRVVSVAWGPWLPRNFLVVSDEVGRKWLFDYDSGDDTFRNTWGAFVVQNRLRPGQTLTLGGVTDMAAQSLWTRVVDVPMASSSTNVTAGILSEGVASGLPASGAPASPTPRAAALALGDLELGQGHADLALEDAEAGQRDAELSQRDAELGRRDAELDLGGPGLAPGDAELIPGDVELGLGDAELAPELGSGDACAEYDAPGDAGAIVCVEFVSEEERLQACSKNLADAMQRLVDCDVDMLALSDNHKRLRVSLETISKELGHIRKDKESGRDSRKRRCCEIAE